MRETEFSLALDSLRAHEPSAGFRRIRRRGSSLQTFSYLSPTGRAVKDPATLRRIRSLAIPPAWKNVWICPTGDGHIQATGLDARGRKQYRYHPRWRATPARR